MELNKTYNENCLETMKRMPDNFIDCVVTSPPYWGLRDYGHDEQIGLEATPEEYVSKMIEIFREVRRVLKPEGTLWLNLGDTYAQQRGGRSYGSHDSMTGRGEAPNNGSVIPPPGFKPKDLIGIPWRVAFALQSDGWWLRQDIIWAKPNPMPESVRDRCTKAHEYIFLLTKSERYFYDAEAIKTKGAGNKWGKHTNPKYGNSTNGKMQSIKELTKEEYIDKYQWSNRKSVWGIKTIPFPEAHFATFPLELPSLCILAGSPKDGIVYDPFMGAATTALAALKYGRRFTGSEINPEYCEIGNKRIAPYLQQMTLAI